MQLLLDCLNCRRGLEHGETGIDMFVLPGIGLLYHKRCLSKLRETVQAKEERGKSWYLSGEGTVVENPVKSLALSPISLRGVIIFRDGNSLLDCNKMEDKDG
jgi:hypothetical protein